MTDPTSPFCLLCRILWDWLRVLVSLSYLSDFGHCFFPFSLMFLGFVMAEMWDRADDGGGYIANASGLHRDNMWWHEALQIFTHLEFSEGWIRKEQWQQPSWSVKRVWSGSYSKALFVRTREGWKVYCPIGTGWTPLLACYIEIGTNNDLSKISYLFLPKHIAFDVSSPLSHLIAVKLTQWFAPARYTLRGHQHSKVHVSTYEHTFLNAFQQSTWFAHLCFKVESQCITEFYAMHLNCSWRHAPT